jgi:predicted PurR-regulated permease PerM
MGRGLAVPMPVILVGTIGGMLLSGIVGLFIGAVILALAYKLFTAWVFEDGGDDDGDESGDAVE